MTLSFGVQRSLTLGDRVAGLKCLGLSFQVFGLLGERRLMQ
ncbi:MAG TPA: hypothetical protein V6D27_04490 [Vampirovibrionales bacterium]